MATLYLEFFGSSDDDHTEIKTSAIRSEPFPGRTAVAMNVLGNATTLADTMMMCRACLKMSIDVGEEEYANILIISATDINPIMARNLANRLFCV